MKFYEDVKSRLAHRISGFDYIFDYLKTIENPFIVETGCARQENNYEGDGQSSLLFDKYINEYGGQFITVDISEHSVNYCQSKIISDKSTVVLHDSIIFLKQLNQLLLNTNKKIDFLYLDSFDAPKDQPDVLFQSALHHFYEFTTILPSLKKGALVGIDDNWYANGNCGGKGSFIFDYMRKINNLPTLQDYQLFYIL